MSRHDLPNKTRKLKKIDEFIRESTIRDDLENTIYRWRDGEYDIEETLSIIFSDLANELEELNDRINDLIREVVRE